jgi:predicted MFS family arabinose efflux permease
MEKMQHKIAALFDGLTKEILTLTAINFINRVGAMVICFLTLYLTERLHFDLISAGYIMSCYGIGAIVGAYLGGFLTDKLGYQRVQVLSLIFNGIFLLVILYQTTFYALCINLFLLNVAAEAFRPANSVAVKACSNDANRTKAFSFLRVGINLAVAIALALGGFLISFGWEYIFWIDALTCFAAAIFIVWIVPTKAVAQKETVTAAIKDAQNPYKDRHFLAFVGLTFLAAMIFMQIVWTVPPYFKKVYGWDEATIGYISAINGLVVMLVEFPLVLFVQHKKSQKWLIRLGLFFYLLSYAALTLPVGLAYFSAIFYMVAISFGEIFVMPFSSTYVTQIAPTATQGKYLALYTMAYSVSNVIAPLMGTQIIDRFGFDTLWVVIAVMSAFAMLGFYFLEKK